MKVFIAPKSNNPNAVGGIPRVVEAQTRHLSNYDIELVDYPEQADLVAVHAATWVETDKPVVTHCHGLYWADYNWNSAWYDAVNQDVIYAMTRAQAITVPSQWVRDSVARGSWLDPVVIGHGVDLSEWPMDNTHQGYILWDKSRLDPACDPRAVNVLAGTMPDVRFVTSFGNEAANVSVVGAVPYNEHKQHVQKAMLYLATARETFGISVLEALACGVPVVGWDWAGQADILRDSGCGYLATPGDYDSLQRGIQLCINKRDSISAACRQLVTDKYQWKDVIGQYASLYHSVLNNNKHEVKVSVIISSYNLSKYLPACIESCLRQDYDSYEVIVVDDCSTDSSYQLAKEYESKLPSRVRVFKTPRNGNMPTVLNLGIANSHGEYILPLDADNMLAPGALRTLVTCIDGIELDCVYGKIKFVLDDGETPDREVAGDGISAWPPRDFSYEAQMNHRNQIPSTALYRKKLWQQVGGYRMRCSRIGEDPDFWCRITSVGARCKRATDAVTLIYRMRGESRSHVQPEWAWENWYTRRPIQVGGPIHIIDKPIVSVIIPVGPGHGVQAIEDALDSVYSQTMHEWECIVVDDTDDEIRWLPSWMTVIKTPSPASGVSVARNLGITQARGEAFVLLDADDYLESTALSKMYKAWRNYGGYVYTDWYKDGEPVSIDPHDCVDQLNNLRHPITCMYPINVRDFCSFNEEMKYGEDWDYVLQVLKAGWCGTHLKDPLVYYRQQSGSNRKLLQDNIGKLRELMLGRYSGMGCGCSNGGGLPAIDYDQIAQNNNSLMGSSNELVLLKYVKPNTATITYTGQTTGATYRFGSEPGHDKRYVHRADAEFLLNRPEFELANTAVPV